MVKKHLFQYGDNNFHILQLKTKRQLHGRREEAAAQARKTTGIGVYG